MNPDHLAASLQIIASKMRELGVVRLKTESVEIELGALAPAPVAKPKRELTDLDYAFAATEGLPDPNGEPDEDGD